MHCEAKNSYDLLYCNNHFCGGLKLNPYNILRCSPNYNELNVEAQSTETVDLSAKLPMDVSDT